MFKKYGSSLAVLSCLTTAACGPITPSVSKAAGSSSSADSLTSSSNTGFVAAERVNSLAPSPEGNEVTLEIRETQFLSKYSDAPGAAANHENPFEEALGHAPESRVELGSQEHPVVIDTQTGSIAIPLGSLAPLTRRSKVHVLIELNRHLSEFPAPELLPKLHLSVTRVSRNRSGAAQAVTLSFSQPHSGTAASESPDQLLHDIQRIALFESDER